MTVKRHIKAGIRLIIEAEANPVTIIMRLSKGQLIKVLDVLIPDEPDVPVESQEKPL
jgi:hypothetical protein